MANAAAATSAVSVFVISVSSRAPSSSCDQSFVQSFQLGIPIEDRRQCRRVKALPQSLASPFDMSQTSSLAAVIVIGSKAGDGGGLFAADAADLRSEERRVGKEWRSRGS